MENEIQEKEKEENITDKLLDSVAKWVYINEDKYKVILGTGFFLKIKINQEEVLFFCTTNDSLKALGLYNKEIMLILNNKDEKGEHIKIHFNLYKQNKKQINDFVFIEILEFEIPDNLTLSFLEVEETNLFNPSKYINSQIILAGYPKTNIGETDVKPILNFGKIKRIKEGNNVTKILYTLETNNCSCGDPVCLIDENNKLKLIAIHQGYDEHEDNNYITGILVKSLINKIAENISIDAKKYEEIRNVKQIIKFIIDKFESCGIKDLLKDNFISQENYEKIFFYQSKIIEEYKNWDEYRKFIYQHLLENHLLYYSTSKLGDLNKTFMIVIDDFTDIQSTLDMISTFNNDILTCFNIILLSDDYKLRAKLIFFISKYIQTLKEMDYTYKYRDVSLYHRTIMNLDQLNKINEKTNQIFVNQYFIRDVIPISIFSSWYKSYYDIKMYFWIKYAKTMAVIHPTDYDTRFYIKQQNSGKSEQYFNIFKITNWPDLIIAPFNYFKVESVEINDINKTADINLTLINKEN